jgi:arylsulfatase B
MSQVPPQYFNQFLSKFKTMKNLLTFFLLLISIATTTAQRNVVLIIADDLGSNWCGFQENSVDTVNMPNVRKLLSRGVRFSNAWANPVCSPTRAGILTGRYSFRTNVGNVVTNAMQLDTAEITIPKLLKNANAPTKYVSANVGKWHVSAPNAANYNHPNRLGYDYYAGVFTGQPVSTYTNWAKVTNGVASTSVNYLTTETTTDAVNWLNQQGTKPFFLWLAFNSPHSPYHLPPDSLIINRTLSGTTADINANPKSYFKVMAEAMDNRIGKIVEWLEVNNKMDNTDIIFIGDNGNAGRTVQGTPATRAKSTVYQEGIHVPFIISGPSVVNQGRVSNALVNVHDLFATIVELAGYTNWRTQIPAAKPVDSKSLVPILKNTATEARPWAYSEIFDVSTTSEVNARTIRNATYKLINFDSSKVQEFYNLATDASERTNLLTRTLTATELTNYNYLCTEMGTLLGRSICNPKVDTKDLSVSAKPIIAPNPAKSLVSVSFNDALPFDFQLSSIDGKVIKKGISTKDINVSDVSNGLYLLKIQKQDAVFTEKIVVEK